VTDPVQPLVQLTCSRKHGEPRGWRGRELPQLCQSWLVGAAGKGARGRRASANLSSKSSVGRLRLACGLALQLSQPQGEDWFTSHTANGNSAKRVSGASPEARDLCTAAEVQLVAPRRDVRAW
jgi:hypothetical protein